MLSLINLSNNLQATDVKLTGLSFSDLFLDPFLNNGVIFVSFHSEGTILMKTFASCILICSTISKSSVGGFS